MIDTKFLIPAIEPARYFPTESDRVAAMMANVEEISKIKVGDIVTTVHDSEYDSQTVGRVADVEIKDLGDGYHMVTIGWAEHHIIRLGKISEEFHGGSLTTTGGAMFKILEAAPEFDPMDEENSESTTMADDMIAEFGDMPDPEFDGRVCGMGTCMAAATRVALDTDGVTEVPVCEVDSYSTRWWGSWPIKDDSQFTGTVTPDDDPEAPPMGTNKSEPDWTGRVESSIVYAEGAVRMGLKSQEYLRVLVDHIASRRRRMVLREFQSVIKSATSDHMAGKITTIERNDRVRAACIAREGVSLAKV